PLIILIFPSFPPPRPLPLFPYTTLFRSRALPLVATNPANFVEPQFHPAHDAMLCIAQSAYVESEDRRVSSAEAWLKPAEAMEDADRKSTRLNSSHVKISYAVFCLKKKKL